MVRVERLGQVRVALSTALTRVAAGSDVRTIWAKADAEIIFVYSSTLEDGGVVPPTAHDRIPTGTSWPLEIGDKRLFVAAVIGAPNATLTGSS